MTFTLNKTHLTKLAQMFLPILRYYKIQNVMFIPQE